MWKLKTIEAENLCAFRSLSYMLRQGVTTLIFGDNRDNESQQSNGAGKSALLECIAVGITGSPLRKIRSEEIINDAAEECRIALRFINDSAAEELLVNRRIPRKGASSVSCTLYRGGKQVVTDEAVQPSVDAYNRYILDKLGITRDELLNNFILSKGCSQIISISKTLILFLLNNLKTAEVVFLFISSQQFYRLITGMIIHKKQLQI